MTTARILNQAQAEAVYSAMCAMNNVGGRIDAAMPAGGGTGARVRETVHGQILVAGEFRGEAHGGPWKELYDNQHAFANAYGLNSDEWQSDVAAAAGGLTQTAIER